MKAGRSLICALRGAIRLGNANNGDNAGSLYLNGNNAPSNANANDGAVLNNPISYKRVSLPYRENISQDDGETRRFQAERRTRRRELQILHQTHQCFTFKTPFVMRRIRDTRENETLRNAEVAFDRFAFQKHKRWNVIRFEEALDENLRLVLQDIIDESFSPAGYDEKWIFEKKARKLAKAPVYDHVTEAAAMLPYERQVYDHISWRAPAVRPKLGTHALVRFIRNDLYACSQREMYYNFSLDIHHYFPLMDHELLHQKIDNKFKDGKFRRLVHRVIDSYPQGAPLGIKMAQLFGMLFLADFDRLVERFFDIAKDPERMAYWTSRYITEWVLTATTPDERLILSQGSQYLAARFHHFARDGIRHYYRFVDNILIFHEDKPFLRIIRELVIMTLTRDYRASINGDYQIRPTWRGVRLVGYTFYHERLEIGKLNKQKLARRIHRLQSLGYDEEQIRRKVASQLGYVKHADTINLFKTLGMEKSLGKIIKNRRIKPPFAGMTPEQKVNFSSLVVKIPDTTGGGKSDIKILLLDYVVQDSKIDKESVRTLETDSSGNQQEISRSVPSKALAIRFKKILKTFTTTGINGEDNESYLFQKKLDEKGQPTDTDAEFYAFTGSRIMIDQALYDFSTQDLPAPTVIRQVKGKDGKVYTKFT